MRIVIINQPTNNRGDEAAHRSLVRALVRQYPMSTIHVVFFGEQSDSIRQMQVEGERVIYVCVPCRRGKLRIPKMALKWKLERLTARVHPGFRRMWGYIKSADLVICAPGGICMGLFQNWTHIYLLQMAALCKKRVAYYSRSFGPFPMETKDNQVFRGISMTLLKDFDFLSIRDTKTMSLADDIGVPYVHAIDTAFLDTPEARVPDELLSLVDTLDYVVFVPNSLTWHPAYRDAHSHEIDKFYLSVIDIILKKYTSAKLVMLPQLFNCGAEGDERYCISLQRRARSNRVVVVPESYSSDIQQAVIARSRVVIGARYHSVVFALNNDVPFVALSYEHKIDGLLEALGRSEHKVDITMLGRDGFDTIGSVREVESRIEVAGRGVGAKSRAREIAVKCFRELCSRYSE